MDKNKKLKDPDIVGMWIEALAAATLLVQKYGMSKAGDRSMVKENKPLNPEIGRRIFLNGNMFGCCL